MGSGRTVVFADQCILAQRIQGYKAEASRYLPTNALVVDILSRRGSEPDMLRTVGPKSIPKPASSHEHNDAIALEAQLNE